MKQSTALAREPLVLRPYQEEALEAVASNFLKGDPVWRQLITLPTGTGKTVLFASLPEYNGLATWLEQFPAMQRKMLVIAHREELLDQAADKIAWANPQLMVEIEQADRKASPMADVVVASIQTLAARAGRRMEKFYPEQFKIVVVDEAHHAGGAQTYHLVLRYFGFLPPDEFMPRDKPFKNAAEAIEFQRKRLLEWDEIAPKRRLLLGVTATAKRGDNIGLESVFQEVVFHRSIRDMIEAGYLCRLRAIRVESKTSLDEVHTRAGDFAVDELCQAIDTKERNQLAVKAYLEHAKGRKALVFTANVQHAKDQANEFVTAGLKAEAIYGGLPHDERKAMLKRFHDGKTAILTNCQILTEGFDEPNIDCIIHARPTKSSLLYIQCTGRGTRNAPGKKDCLIIDIVDITRRHSLITTPDIVGLPANFNLEGEDVLAVVNEVERLSAEHQYLNVEDARSLKDLKTRAEEVDLFAMTNELIQNNSTLAWLKYGNGYHITWPGDFGGKDGVDVVENTLGKWDVSFKEENAEAVAIASPQSDLPNAFHAAENWLRKNRPHIVRMKDRSSQWRLEPATPAQLNYLIRLGARFMPEINKGDASQLIDIYLQRKQSAQTKAKRRRRP